MRECYRRNDEKEHKPRARSSLREAQPQPDGPEDQGEREAVVEKSHPCRPVECEEQREQCGEIGRGTNRLSKVAKAEDKKNQVHAQNKTVREQKRTELRERQQCVVI